MKGKRVLHASVTLISVWAAAHFQKPYQIPKIALVHSRILHRHDTAATVYVREVMIQSNHICIVRHFIPYSAVRVVHKVSAEPDDSVDLYDGGFQYSPLDIRLDVSIVARPKAG